MIDQNVVKKIVNFAGVDNRIVLEIGAGPGTLTGYLSQVATKVYAVEIDKKILNILQGTCGNIENVEIINEDFLKLDVKKLSNKINEGDIEKAGIKTDILQRLCIVGNLPYYVTSQILFKIFEYKDYIEHFTVMVQKEVAQRLLSKPGTKDYGILTVAVNFYCEIEDYFNVSKNVFYPKPDVDSTVIKAKFKKEIPNVDEKSFFRFVHACFNTRRKTILNSISNGLGIEKDVLEKIFERANINKTLRAEDMSLDELIFLFKRLEEAEGFKNDSVQ